MMDARTAAARIFSNAFVFFSALLAFSLPVSFFLISVSQFGLAFCWLFAPGMRERLIHLCRNTWALLLMGIMVLHAIYLSRGNNFSFALDDFRIKLPLLLLPLFFGSWPGFDARSSRWVLFALMAGCWLACAAGLRMYLGWDKDPFIDTRQLGYFVSHVRLAALLAITTTAAIASFIDTRHRIWKIFCLLSAVLFVGYLLIMQSPTGLFLLVIAPCLYLFYRKKESIRWKLLLVFAVALVFASLGFDRFLRYYEAKYFSPSVEYSLPEKWISASGHHYSHELIEDFSENGEYVGWYQCPAEYEKEWKLRSSFPIEGKDRKGQYIRFTLMRYMTSLHLSKDSVGMSRMKAEDIRRVEEGITNASFTQFDGIRYRLYQLAYEWMNFRKGGNPSGHSVVMRLYFWQCALQIIRDHFFIGTGSGGMHQAYKDTYVAIHSPLSPDHRLRAHNQWLSFLVAFGVPIGLLIVYCFCYPLFAGPQKTILFSVLWTLCLLTFFSEDTIESSVGATMTAFLGMFFYHTFTSEGERS